MFVPDDTIVAIATPPGRGGIGVVRLSGPEARSIAESLLDAGGPLRPRHATFSRVLDPPSGLVIDHVVATWFAGPQSYTGEDVVEISGHGSPLLLERIVELATNAGARLAEPGEFTLRAYLGGRLTLPQAEAVADLVNAVTPIQARVAMDQLEGTLTEEIGRGDAALFDLAAKLEASIDFPDEGFHFIGREEARQTVATVREALDDLARTGRAGRVLREGRTVVITGRPNAGKSSLFNALLGVSRAIVADTPGTTRDLLTERVDIAGLELTLVDTAGLREARDHIEAEGVSRARRAQQVAALTLIVIDAGAELTEEDRSVARESPSPSLIVVAKTDQPRAWELSNLGIADRETIETSARSGEGLDRLKQRIAATLLGQDMLRDVPRISNIRHLNLVDAARHALSLAEAAIDDGATEELVLVHIETARHALEEITGRRTTDDLLRHIFSRFCVGK